MAFDYSELADDAEELLEEFGRDVKFHPPRTASDADAPWAPDTEATPVTAKAVVADYGKALQREGVVQREDKRVLVSAKHFGSVELTTEWTVTDGAKRYTVVDVDEVAPGDTRIIYDLQVRG